MLRCWGGGIRDLEFWGVEMGCVIIRVGDVEVFGLGVLWWEVLG